MFLSTPSKKAGKRKNRKPTLTRLGKLTTKNEENTLPEISSGHI